MLSRCRETFRQGSSLCPDGGDALSGRHLEICRIFAGNLRKKDKRVLRTNRYVRALCVLLSVMAAGCMKYSADPACQEGGNLPISFSAPVVSTITKADASCAAYPESSSFGVYALYCPDGNFAGWENTSGAKPYIDGAEFRYDGALDDATPGKGGWVSDPPYYWPTAGKMTFAAWSPYSVKKTYGPGFSYGKTGLSIEGFTTGPKDGVDLMYSERVYDKSSSLGANSVHDGIDIVFHHALAALSFRAASSVSGVTVDITKIMIWGISRKGDFHENVRETATSPSTYVSEPVWTDVTDKYTDSDPLVVDWSMSSYSGGGKVSPSHDMFIIPQAISDGARMKVYYTVKVGDSSPVPAVSQEVELSGRKTVSQEAVLDEWKMAHRYVYTLRLGLQPIRFSVDVSPWGGDGI